MCYSWSTRDRAVIESHYTVDTLLLNPGCYCPLGPNYQDYSCRSRLYNPDPKYQCNDDLTCHLYDSKGKSPCCSGLGYQKVSTAQMAWNNTFPCTTNGMCAEPPSCCPSPSPCCPIRCRRRRIRPPACCCPKRTYRDLLEDWDRLDEKKKCKPQKCENNNCQDTSDNCSSILCPGGGNGDVGDCDYKVTIPAQPGDCSSSKISYNCGQFGTLCSTNVSVSSNGCQDCQP